MRLILLSFILLPLFSCHSSKVVKQNEVANIEGTYRGILPCSNCQGIETILSLTKDLHFTLVRHYFGGEEKTVTTSGTYQFIKDGKGISLSDKQGNYWWENGKLEESDLDGNRVAADIAPLYCLQNLNGSIAERYWKVTAVNGKSMSLFSGIRREPHIIFHLNANSVNGNSGCNLFSGTWQSKGRGDLSFGKLVSTKMACMENNPEQEIMEVLSGSVQYSLNADKLEITGLSAGPNSPRSSLSLEALGLP